MTTVIDLLADASPTGDDLVYVINDPSGTPGNRKVTLANLATALAGMGGGSFVTTAGSQNITGVKTFTVDPIIPDEAFGVGWNGVLEPPTKNAVYDQFAALPNLDTATPLAISIYTAGGNTFVDYIGSGGGSIVDTTIFVDNADANKQFQFEASGLTSSGIPRVYTAPDASGTLVLLTATQVLTNKRLSLPTTIGTTATLAAITALGSLLDDSVLDLDYASVVSPASVYDLGVHTFVQAGHISHAGAFMYGARTLKNENASALSLGQLRGYVDNQTIQGDGAATTASGYVAFRAAPVFNVINAGTLAISSVNCFGVAAQVGTGVTLTTFNVHGSAPSVPGGTVTTLSHYKGNNVTPSGGGVITNFYGINIDQIVGGSTINLGMRMAGGIQYEPTARSIAAVGDSLVATAGVLAPAYDLTNTSGGSLTLTSTPMLPDGYANGQEVVLLNVGAQNIVVSDESLVPGSNLRLSATTITLGPRDSLRLRWSSGIGDWVQMGFSNLI